MRNKKRMALLAAGGMMAVMNPAAVQALTVGVPQRDGTTAYYQLVEPDVETAVQIAAGTNVVGDRFSRELFKESLAYLEKYGVTYEVDTDRVLYQGEKVRWIIDNQVAGYEANTLIAEDGITDIYLERDADGKLLGVRKASREEFDRLSAEQKAEEELLIVEGLNAEASEAETVEESADAWSIMKDDEAEKESGEGVILEIEESSTASGSSWLSREEKEREYQRAQEYEAIGIGQSESGNWIWNGKKILILMDEDGSFYQCGNAAEDKLYVYVSRDEEGKAIKAEVVSGKELLEKKALLDTAE